MHHSYTTQVPERLNADLAKSRLTVRYLDNCGQERTVEFESAYLEFIPRVVGYNSQQGVSRVPLDAVQSVEVDDEFTSSCDTDQHGVEVPQRLAVARWHRTHWGDLIRFVPQGNAE